MIQCSLNCELKSKGTIFTLQIYDMKYFNIILCVSVCDFVLLVFSSKNSLHGPFSLLQLFKMMMWFANINSTSADSTYWCSLCSTVYLSCFDPFFPHCTQLPQHCTSLPKLQKWPGDSQMPQQPWAASTCFTLKQVDRFSNGGYVLRENTCRSDRGGGISYWLLHTEKLVLLLDKRKTTIRVEPKGEKEV